MKYFITFYTPKKSDSFTLSKAVIYMEFCAICSEFLLIQIKVVYK